MINTLVASRRQMHYFLVEGPFLGDVFLKFLVNSLLIVYTLTIFDFLGAVVTY